MQISSLVKIKNLKRYSLFRPLWGFSRCLIQIEFAILEVSNLKTVTSANHSSRITINNLLYIPLEVTPKGAKVSD